MPKFWCFKGITCSISWRACSWHWGAPTGVFAATHGWLAIKVWSLWGLPFLYNSHAQCTCSEHRSVCFSGKNDRDQYDPRWPSTTLFWCKCCDLIVYNEVKSGVDLTEIHDWDIQEKMMKVGSPVFAFWLSICVMNGVTPSVAEEGKIHWRSPRCATVRGLLLAVWLWFFQTW